MRKEKSETRDPFRPGNLGRFPCIVVVSIALLAVSMDVEAPAQARGPAWTRHTIDDSSRGADGTRLADVNGDGLMDITTGWEEGGRIRVYLNPGPARVKDKWPAVTVGKVKSPEDAVFVDLDADGAVDVVSSCEGKNRTMYVHWAPKDKSKYLDASAWKTEPIPASQNAMQWMFCLPLQVDGRNGIDLIGSAKGPGAKIGWFESPANPRVLGDWKWHPLRNAGWIMSLIAADMDGDGDLDVLASDRKKEKRGCFWLEKPGPGASPAGPWKEHNIGANDKEVMFITLADLDGDGLRDVLAATRGDELIYLRRSAASPPAWQRFPIRLPPNTGTAKAVEAADIDLDGDTDIVFTCENARGKSAVIWLSYRNAPTDPVWEAHEISGPVGTKYDLVPLLDLDSDGDLDALTSEERENLGVIWYENPTR